jgi:hypothetical protein
MMLQRLKLAFSLLGLLLAIVAIAFNDPRVTWVAIAMLAASVALRFVGRRSRKRAEGGE